MRNKDQMLLENLYLSILEGKVIMDNPESLVGETVFIHPAIAGSPESDPTHYMSWSIKKDKIIHNARTLLLKDCSAKIDHDLVAKFQRNPEKGQKTPNLLVKGTIVAVDFDMNDIPSILSNGDWNSVTYNPHKHTEYIYKDKLPEWWDSDERFPHDNPRNPNLVSDRNKASREREKEKFPYNELSKKDSEQNISRFSCDYILLKQYIKRGEDYMWVKGVHESSD